MHPVAPDMLSPWAPGLFSFGLFVAIVLALLGLLLFLTGWLGERRDRSGKSPAV